MSNILKTAIVQAQVRRLEECGATFVACAYCSFRVDVDPEGALAAAWASVNHTLACEASPAGALRAELTRVEALLVAGRVVVGLLLDHGEGLLTDEQAREVRVGPRLYAFAERAPPDDLDGGGQTSTLTSASASPTLGPAAKEWGGVPVADNVIPANPTHSAALKAINHVLTRAQLDPDFRWHLSGTESFDLLCAAEAELTGKPVDAVRKLRGVRLTPTYREQRAREVILQEKVDQLEQRLDDAGVTL